MQVAFPRSKYQLIIQRLPHKDIGTIAWPPTLQQHGQLLSEKLNRTTHTQHVDMRAVGEARTCLHWGTEQQTSQRPSGISSMASFRSARPDQTCRTWFNTGTLHNDMPRAQNGFDCLKCNAPKPKTASPFSPPSGCVFACKLYEAWRMDGSGSGRNEDPRSKLGRFRSA